MWALDGVCQTDEKGWNQNIFSSILPIVYRRQSEANINIIHNPIDFIVTSRKRIETIGEKAKLNLLFTFMNYSRVHISSDTAFLKILKEPSIVQE